MQDVVNRGKHQETQGTYHHRCQDLLHAQKTYGSGRRPGLLPGRGNETPPQTDRHLAQFRVGHVAATAGRLACKMEMGRRLPEAQRITWLELIAGFEGTVQHAQQTWFPTVINAIINSWSRRPVKEAETMEPAPEAGGIPSATHSFMLGAVTAPNPLVPTSTSPSCSPLSLCSSLRLSPAPVSRSSSSIFVRTDTHRTPHRSPSRSSFHVLSTS